MRPSSSTSARARVTRRRSATESPSIGWRGSISTRSFSSTAAARFQSERQRTMPPAPRGKWGVPSSRFSATVRPPKVSSCWCMVRMPRCSASEGWPRLTGRPSTRTVPESGRTAPERTLIRVLLPAPFLPTMPVISPGVKLRLTSASATTAE